jgi:hypothetical protein
MKPILRDGDEEEEFSKVIEIKIKLNIYSTISETQCSSMK